MTSFENAGSLESQVVELEKIVKKHDGLYTYVRLALYIIPILAVIVSGILIYLGFTTEENVIKHFERRITIDEISAAIADRLIHDSTALQIHLPENVFNIDTAIITGIAARVAESTFIAEVQSYSSKDPMFMQDKVIWESVPFNETRSELKDYCDSLRHRQTDSISVVNIAPGETFKRLDSLELWIQVDHQLDPKYIELLTVAVVPEGREHLFENSEFSDTYECTGPYNKIRCVTPEQEGFHSLVVVYTRRYHSYSCRSFLKTIPIQVKEK